MNNEELFRFLIEEAEHPFAGWDFSHISDTGRVAEAPLSWSYTSKLLMRLRNVQSLLDIDTGGGEFLAELQPLPPYTCATEAYAPNVSIAQQRLEQLGVQVYDLVDKEGVLPFGDEQFELVINRHGYYVPQEVMRVLKSGGTFITQQVGGSNEADLNTLLGAGEYTYADWTLERAALELEVAGLNVMERRDDYPVVRYFDVGAIVYYLKVVSWQIPDFTVERYFDKLANIHDIIQAKGYIDVHYHRFLIVAQK